MKFSTKKSAAAHVVDNDKSNVRNIKRFDPALVNLIERDFGIVMDSGIKVADALSSGNQREFHRCIAHFRLILKTYLKKVGVNLYVHLRHEMKNDRRSPKLSEFENWVRDELINVANFFSNTRNTDWSERQALRVELLNVMVLLTKIHEQEKSYLHPLYLELSNETPVGEQHAA